MNECTQKIRLSRCHDKNQKRKVPDLSSCCDLLIFYNFYKKKYKFVQK